MRVLLTIFIFLSGFSGFSNENDSTKVEKRWDFSDKLYTGGGLGLNFGTTTVANISPIIGYNFTENFSSGIGVSYQYISNRFYSQSIIGGSIFSRYRILEQLFAHAEYETLSLTPYNDFGEKLPRTFADGFLLGGRL